MMYERITKAKHIAVIVLCLTLAVCVSILTWRLSGTLREVKDTAAVMHGTADDVSQAVKEQIAIFRSPAYQKNYEHASELGDIAAKTVAQIARQTIPRVNGAVDELKARLHDMEPTQKELARATSNLADFEKNLDSSFNGEAGLVSSITKIVNKSGATLDELNVALNQAAEGLGMTTAELKRRLADRRVDAIMDEALGILQEGHGTMAQVHKASEQAPSIAADLEKIAHESSKFARVTLVANILGTLGRAFLP